MSINRRGFLAAGAAAAGLSTASAPSAGRAAEPEAKAALKLSSQLGIIPGKSLQEKIKKMEEWGFDGVELPGDIVGKEKTFKEAIQGTRLKFSAVCWGSINGDIVSENESKRAPAVEALKKVLAAAAELGSTGVIYVPAFNGQTKLTNQEIRKILEDTFPAFGEYAVKVGSRCSSSRSTAARPSSSASWPTRPRSAATPRAPASA